MPLFGTEKADKPFILTIFGASGDLAKLKIFPSLYRLMEHKRLPKKFFIVGFARTKKARAAFQKEFADSVREVIGESLNPSVLKELLNHVHYVTGDYGTLEDFNSFGKFLKELSPIPCEKLFYFSVPPVAFRPIIQNLGESTIPYKKQFRLILEKPFGEDTESATELFHFVARYFTEEQIYLLDHYLGKSAVQSILYLRHSNRILNLMLKGREIANIQITAFENIGIKDRVGYFDQVGIFKDMIQSHLMQLLALVTMSIPVTNRAASLHKEKYSILSALDLPRSGKNVVQGQYVSYRKNPEVPKGSNTETFAALRLFIDRESWYKVPIYIRTGKMLHEKHTYITVELKKFDFQFPEEDPNRLIFELQPDEKLHIKLINKHGGGTVAQDVLTTDSIACEGDNCLPEHARLLLDVMGGNKVYFLSFPEIIASWALLDQVLGRVERGKVPLHHYKDGGKGPNQQHLLTKIDGFEWFDLHNL
ncbi:MAG: glucose-6-phosphate dehydrogenase [Candidatus Peregrinibacteria bacterium]|nr:glucose-6-phosphate dehydrogenase [Candidatus Peregrinibacteria bacterium]